VIAQHTTGLLALESVPMGWRSDFQYSGKNILTMGIIQEMINRWIPEDPVRIDARARFATNKRTHFERGTQEQTRIPDSITVCADYPSGALLLHHISALSSGTPRGEIKLNGSKGSLRFDLLATRLYYADAGASTEVELHADPAVGDGWRVEEEFVESIRSGKPVLRTNFTDGLRYMRFTEAVHAAWSQNVH
jgi:predicted dehydrogenase